MKRSLENIKVAFQALFLNKLRSFLTMLGIIIGVGAVIIIMAIGSGAQSSIVSNIQSMGTNLLTIEPGRDTTRPGGGPVEFNRNSTPTVRGDLYLSDYKALKNASTLTGAAAIVQRSSTVTYMGVSESVSILGATDDIFKIRNYKISSGNFFNESNVSNSSNVAVIGQQIIDDFFGRIDPIGETIKIDKQNFTIVGTLQSLGSNAMGQNQDAIIIIPVTTAQNKLYGLSTVNNIIAQVKDESLIDQATSEITSILRQQHHILSGKLNDFEIRNPSQMLETMSSVTNTLALMLAGIAAISLLVGGIGIMNIMLVSVTERTREIGIRKAIGAKNKDILTQFLTESIVLSITGGILGIIFAVVISFILSKFAGINTAITATPIILALSFSTLIGLIFGIVPAMRAARLNPIESLRYE
ncbi:MAG: ABC transporter permease [Actinobacteria bacterium]|nr:ABC transporter permease [Cyanobacteriota bacterium]MCL5772491.1 ABC transporter permease [Actinomycetota bacterium]